MEAAKKATPAKRMLYSNDMGDIKDQLLDEVNSMFGYRKFYSLTEAPEDALQAAYQVIDDANWSDFEAALGHLEQAQGTYGYVFKGYVQTWRGRYETGFPIENFDKAGQFISFSDMNVLRIFDVNGHLYLQASHHDGTNLYEIKLLTEKGYNFCSEYGWTPTKNLVDKLFKSRVYSALPHLGSRQYGLSKIENVRKR